MKNNYFELCTFNLSLFMRLKLWLFGKKHVSFAGGVECVAYEYRGKLYITKLSR